VRRGASTKNPAVAAKSFGRKEWLFVVALAAAVLMVYQPAWQGGFLWDDNAHVTRPQLRTWYGLGRIWFELGATQQYYPLLHSVFWLEHKLWGDATLGYHLTSILLHTAAAVLAALILRRLSIPGAFLAAAVFALHPIQVESVAWITELKNTLSAVFYFGAAMAYLHFDDTRKKSFYAMAFGLFVLGLTSKTVTATLPAALLVIFWWRRGRLSWRSDVLPLVPFFIFGAAAGVFTAWVEHSMIGAKGEAFDLTIVERCLLCGRVVWFYLGKILWPAHLLFIYPRWQIDPSSAWQYLYPAFLLLTLGVLWWLRGRWRGPLAGFLYFVGTLFPVLGFCNVYPFLFSFVADHFQYLACLGIIALASSGMALLLERIGVWGRPAGYGACLILLAALGCLTWRQSRMYADEETLYRTTLDRNPDGFMAHNNLGTILADRGRYEEAIEHYRKALAIKPNFAEVHGNYGVALAALDRFAEAVSHYRTALEKNPNLVDVHFQLGKALHRQKEFSEAIEHYRKAITYKPDKAEIYGNLGNTLLDSGQMDEAIGAYRKALEIDPDYTDAHNNLGATLARRGQISEAIAHFQAALELKPELASARKNLELALAVWQQTQKSLADKRKQILLHPKDAALLNDTAWTLATDPDPAVRNGAEAVNLAQKAVELSGGRDPAMLDTLAAAYAEAGRFAEAVQTARAATKSASEQNRPDLVKSIEMKIRLYEAKTPFHALPASPPADDEP
jgi:protein O-mannosyl-transferase